MPDHESGSPGFHDDDDQKLESLGYVPSFKREFSNLATISFAFSIMGLCSSVATTFNTPLLLGGPSSVTWCWILGATMCFTLGNSLPFLALAFPTCGGLYTASARLVPKRHRPIVGWVVGWLNILGQVAGLSSTEFGLSTMIWAAVVVAKDGNYEVTSGKVVGLFVGLLLFHGILNCLATRHLANFTKGFVFINLGTSVIIVIVLLATTERHEMHSASYVFGSEGVVNQTNGWNSGLAFLFGLLSVQWTDYDATAHISEEVKRAAYAAPAAIFIAVIGTGLLGWLLNIVLILCSGPLCVKPTVPRISLMIMALRMGKTGALFLWTFVCLTAFFVCQTALQACSRTVYAFSRDHGTSFTSSRFPDRGYFGYVSKLTHTPLRAIWLSTIFSILPGLLDFASPVAASAIFSLTAMALDISYIIPIALRRIYQHHPEVQFKPGPFYMGDGLLGWAVNINCIVWTLFVSVIFSLPTYLPVTKDTMNYASVITGGVVLLAMIWYFIDGRRHYHGPHANFQDGVTPTIIGIGEGDGEKASISSKDEGKEEGSLLSLNNHD
ncbi:amino acid/polyamine transporter I [Multifurca ochricompacta]|uniref:Amino acid/polyamine transporter I n=1 Tax=Multifurca ochricompacta TaxID=376703 RepID=A0AAD4M1U2_9AGAM|nr:amino acid/polyamine transporter I [Multifurca ochricompacta]